MFNFGRKFLILIVGIFISWAAIGASYADTLKIAYLTAPPPTLDPFKIYGSRVQSLYRQMFENLIDRDEKGKLIPAIAERWRYRGNNVWRLHLRGDVLFQDGSRLSSRDVKFSLERLTSPTSARSRRRDFSFITRVEVVNDRVVDIYTKGPAATLPARMAQFSMILPEKKVRKMGEEAFFKKPIGAGPFSLVSIDKKQVILKRHDRYYRGKPGVERVRFEFVEDPRQRVKMLLDGKLDVLPNVLSAFTRKIAAQPNVSIVKKPALQFTYVVFDTLSSGPLRDSRVRNALAYWLDVPSLIRYVENGNGRRIATFVMPEEFGFNPKLKPYFFDAKRAKGLMKEAGHSKGFTLSGLASDEVAPLARAVARQWARIGVKMNVKVVSRSQAIRLWIKTKDYQAYFFAPTNLLFDASYHLKSKLDSLHPVNRFHHPEAIQLVKKMDGIEDPDKRRDVLHRLQQIVHQEIPAIAFYQRISIYGVSEKVRGFKAYPDTILRLHEIKLSPSGGRESNKVKK